MGFVAGSRLAQYEILGALGAGGMGQVYRARDTRLNRDVAIKILPDAFAADADRMSRFTREAQTLASLNHPNIAQIYGQEEDGAGSTRTRALILELVEGVDLSELVARGPMAPVEVLAIARQLAEALEAAHELGIIHRDLKPANIKVRADGTVKVLDFGLAKAMDAAGGSSADPLNSPTLTRATQAGVILGTAAYMSPEQAKGRPVDKRSDIWAFGVVLHEMLTGTRLFEGESVAETLGLIFAREPDLSALPPNTPAALRSIITRCLIKDPRRRLRDIGEARLQIEDAIAGRGEAASTAAAASVVTPSRATSPWALALALVLAATAGAVATWFARPVPQPQPTHTSIALPPGDQVTTAPAISPDGRLIAYGAGRTATSAQLYLRSLDDGVARPVVGSAGVQYPFFSPDGRSIGFFAGGKLRRSSVAGGAPLDVASAPAPWGGTWAADGHIVYTTGLGSGLWRVPAEGGKPERLTTPDGAATGYAHAFPQRLTGTDDILFAFWGQKYYSGVLSASTRAWRSVTPQGRALTNVALWVPGGYLLTNDGDGGVVAGRWTPDVTSPAALNTPVVERVQWPLNTELSWIAVSDTGTAVYVPGNPSDRRLVWVDRRGSVTPATDTDLMNQGTLSRDGRRVVHGSMRSQWVTDLQTGARTRLISEFRAFHGGWMPGDDRIAFSSNKDGDWDLFTIPANGGAVAPLLTRPFAQHIQAVTADGTVVFLERSPTTGSDLWTLAPGGQAQPLVVTPFNETSASVSPDGRFVAYASDESGREDVFAIPMSGKGERQTISINGGTGPIWSRDGRELFYRAGDDLMSVDVQTTGALVLGERRKLLDISSYDSGYLHEFDVSPDGQRFLLIRTEPASRPYRLDIVTNFIEELRGKVP